MRSSVFALVISCGLVLSAVAATEPAVVRFTPHELTFESSGTYANPYVECAAEAILTEPDGRATRTLPLFWDGGRTWKLRFAPDKVGRWTWSTKSADRGLDGQSGRFRCSPGSHRGSLQPLAGAPRHFQYQNGEHVWFLADTAWALLTDNAEEKHDRAAMERYVRNRGAQGFNAVHCMLLNEAGWANGGGAPWHDIGAEKLNPGYFREAEARIGFANAQGIVVGLALAWGDKGRQEPWAWGRMPSLAARQRYARYVAARFGAYDVYFIVSGEWHGEVRSRRASEKEVRAEFVRIGDALDSADAHHRLIAIHPMTAHGSTREFNEAARWMSFADYQQNYRDLHARILESRALVAKPVVNSEYAYYLRDQNGDGVVDKPNSATIDDIRHATWDITMAGGYVVAGFGSTYMGGHRHPTPFLPDDPQNAIWAEQIGHVKKFFAALEYWRLEPHDEFVTSETPRGADRLTAVAAGKQSLTQIAPPATTYWCLAEPGRNYVVYARGMTTPATVRVNGGATWRVTRFDPRSGRFDVVDAGPSASRVELRGPDAQDWVFIVQAK